MLSLKKKEQGEKILKEIFMDKLEQLRREISDCDASILKILKKRFELCLDVAKLKKKLKIDVFQAEREKEVKEFWKSKKEKVLREEFLMELLDLLLKESKEIQKSS